MIHLPIFYKSYAYFISTNHSGVAKMVSVRVYIYMYKQTFVISVYLITLPVCCSHMYRSNFDLLLVCSHYFIVFLS